ncbi:hypothetical protein BDZ45DRAFT_749258 [Acephala macrosclerotiorum]|nr:hypothetical protein BDZ45DRAFT_749258 [Acephala macrosclerotiorum]
MAYQPQWKAMLAKSTESKNFTVKEMRTYFDACREHIKENILGITNDKVLYEAEWRTWHHFFLGDVFPGVDPEIIVRPIDVNNPATPLEVIQEAKRDSMAQTAKLVANEQVAAMQTKELSKSNAKYQASAAYTTTPDFRKKQLAEKLRIQKVDKENKDLKARVEELEKELTDTIKVLEKEKKGLTSRVTDLENKKVEQEAAYDKLKQESGQNARTLHNGAQKLKSQVANLKRAAEGDVDTGKKKKSKRKLVSGRALKEANASKGAKAASR